jgi:hypothetical protein
MNGNVTVRTTLWVSITTALAGIVFGMLMHEVLWSAVYVDKQRYDVDQARLERRLDEISRKIDHIKDFP